MAALAASSAVEGSCSPSFDGAAVVLRPVATVVFFVFLLLPWDLDFDRSPVGFPETPPGPLGDSFAADGIAVVKPPDGRAGVSDLTFDPIHAKWIKWIFIS